jgi:hypothetical protein
MRYRIPRFGVARLGTRRSCGSCWWRNTPLPRQAGRVEREPHLLPPLVLAIVGPAAFTTAAVFSGRRVSGYSHRDEPVSALAAKKSDAAPVMVMGFLGLAAGSFALGRRLRGTRLPNGISKMLRFSAVTTALAGLAQCSDRSCPSRFLGDTSATHSDELHGIFSMATFVSWIAMPLLAATRGTNLQRKDRVGSLAVGLTAFAGWLGTGLLVRRRAPTWTGAAQRVMVASALVWYPLAAVAAFRER